ncbi:hypothetical protein ACIRO1_46910 [Streptomyces sp. NPDC102381]|uniref:hypothetical protein n=1 Tax=Streptomyces sp. NPDC102381 TaxID=3366164 RepID=UPI003818E740
MTAADVSRMRAQRAGTQPHSNHTLESTLATLRDLALFLLAERGKDVWELVDVHHIEAFLITLPRGRMRRLRFASAQHLVLSDPTQGLSGDETREFAV